MAFTPINKTQKEMIYKDPYLWSSNELVDKTGDIGGVLNNSIVTPDHTLVTSVINAVNKRNISERFSLGKTDFPDVESQAPKMVSADRLKLTTPVFGTMYGKPIIMLHGYEIQDQFEHAHEIAAEEDKVIKNMVHHFNWSYWEIMTSMLVPISKIPELSKGSTTTELSLDLIETLITTMGYKGVKEGLPTAYMSLKTRSVIMKKQKDGTIDEHILTRGFGKRTVTNDGTTVTTTVEEAMPTWYFDIGTRVIFDNNIPDGTIMFVKPKSFAVKFKNIANEIERDYNKKANMNMGAFEYVGRKIGIIHPIGFSWVGTESMVDNMQLPTLTEYKKDGLYQFMGDRYKDSNFFSLKIKMT